MTQPSLTAGMALAVFGPPLSESRDHGLEVIAPVEAVLEFGQVARGVLPANGMVRASDGVLDVAKKGVDPVERRAIYTGTSTAGDDALVGVVWCVEGPETIQTITDHPTPRRNSLLRIATYLGKGKSTHTTQLDALWMALLIGLHGSHKRKLVVSAAPARFPGRSPPM